MEFTSGQTTKLREDGYVQIPGIASAELMNPALRAINHSVGQGMDRKQMETYRSHSFCPELLGRPVILNVLYESGLWDLAESLTGKGNLNLHGAGQIALRFPVMDTPGSMAPHVDGMYEKHNKVRKGTIDSFTMLAGIFLSDIPNQYWGNFTVWPGTHRLYETYFREHGPESLLKGMPNVDLSEPLQITARAGDAVICHYQLGHTVAINVSPHVRYALFFRMIHKNHSSHGKRVFTEIWTEWPGLHE